MGQEIWRDMETRDSANTRHTSVETEQAWRHAKPCLETVSISDRRRLPRLHDTTGCHTGWQTGLTTGLTTVLNEQWLFVQPVVKPVTSWYVILNSRSVK